MRPIRVDWWSASVGALTPDARDALEFACDADEQRRAAKFVFERDRRSYLAAHGLLRRALSDVLPEFEPGHWRFVTASRGRPELDARHACGLRFNLSHCASRVDCLVCAGLDCGIDVEPLDRRPHWPDMDFPCLSPGERAWLAGLPEARRNAHFMRLWTLKEAVAKGTGLGLHLPLEALDFELEPMLRLRSAPAEAIGPWQLIQHICPDGHVESLALRTDREIELVRHEWLGAPCVDLHGRQ